MGTQASGAPVGLPPLVQRPAIPVRARYSPGSWLAIWFIRPSWLWRREIAAVVALGLVAGVTWWLAGWPVAAGAVGCVLGAVAACRPLRGRVVRMWVRASLRRRWDKACRFAGLTTMNDRVPRIKRDRVVPAGVRLEAWVPKGTAVDDLAGQVERIAACLRVREVRVMRDRDRAHVANVEIVRRDPFLIGGYDASPWPWAGRAQARLWDPVPVGVDEMGAGVSVSLAERSILFGGEPGSGKSAGLSLVIGAGALDPWVQIWGLDAKRLELGLWRPVLARVGYSIGDGIALLRDLIEIMEDRYVELEAAGLRKMTPVDGPLYLVPIDELRFYTAHPDRKLRATFNDLAIDVAARGRAAGIILAPATQKPSSDVVPTSLRDLIAYRWAMRCTNRDASDTILGAGWATSGYSAASIDDRTPGVGLLLAEGGAPARVKSHYLTDAQIREIAVRGAALRAGMEDAERGQRAA